MSKQLKDFFDAILVQRIAASYQAVEPRFPARRFIVAACQGLESLELMDRARQIATALRGALPDDYEQAIELMLRTLNAGIGPGLDAQDEGGMGGFFYLPHTLLVAEYGLAHFDASMRAQHALTQRFTAEFSIRPFLVHHPERTLQVLEGWAHDKSEHVRRLVSEGTRPRLPWAARLPAFQRDPRPVLRLLDLLKDDPSLYVRRSVANNLNDIGKDHPDLLLAVCAKWAQPPKGRSEARLWLIRHALRTELKRGNRHALAVLGFEGGEQIRVEGQFDRARVRIGESANITLSLRNASRSVQNIHVNLAVHFVKARGNTNPKVFRVRSLELQPGAAVSVAKKVSFAELTTRRHYPGLHRVEALINGRAVHLGDMDVVSAAERRQLS
jgi:3-methyladenine DNA glycosylase AlkC